MAATVIRRDPSTPADQAWMQVALAMARRGLGTTAPNPCVGAVIVDGAKGEILARGWTQPGGRPHAETEALRRAGHRARGATLYVTLEPCSHHGKTPPCADAIIDAGIGRVVAGIEDPDPRVAGRGLERLREAGVLVERFVCAPQCDWVTRGHILRVTERRPFVQLKMALAGDGEIRRGVAGQPVWVTGSQARAQGHRLRAETDAILVGRQTLLDDDPELTCRLPGAGDRSPLRVVLASRLGLPSASRLVRSARVTPVLVVCGASAPVGERRALEAAGCHVVVVRDVMGTLWLPAVMEVLVGRGISRLLVEGGPTVWTAFATAGLCDEIVAFVATDGDRVQPPAQVERLSQGMERTSIRQVGADLMFVFRRRSPQRADRTDHRNCT